MNKNVCCLDILRCGTEILCEHCKGRHHSLICSSSHWKPTSIDKFNIGASKEAELQKGESAQHLNPDAEVWVGSIGSFCPASGERVALQTTLAKKEGSEKRKEQVLFDSGSQKHFCILQGC